MILVLAEAARNINIAAVRMRKHPNLEYIIVLGAHVEGTRLTKALLERTRRALQYMEENPETKAVLSGGKGDGESITEAQAMCNYLVEHGIGRERLILEEKSTSTTENLKFSLGMIGLNHSVALSPIIFMFSGNGHRKEMWMQRNLSHSFQIPFMETSDIYSKEKSWQSSKIS